MNFVSECMIQLWNYDMVQLYSIMDVLFSIMNSLFYLFVSLFVYLLGACDQREVWPCKVPYNTEIINWTLYRSNSS